MRRSWRDMRFAQRDVNIIGVFVALLLAGVVEDLFLVAAFVYAATVVFVIGLRVALRRRRWEREAPKEFWADRIK